MTRAWIQRRRRGIVRCRSSENRKSNAERLRIRTVRRRGNTQGAGGISRNPSTVQHEMFRRGFVSHLLLITARRQQFRVKVFMSASISRSKQFAPAAERNKDDVLAALQCTLRDIGCPADQQRSIFEVASGSGQHASYFCSRDSSLVIQPTDPDPLALKSIEAYRSELPPEMSNRILPPFFFDASAASKGNAPNLKSEMLQGLEGIDAVLAVNMLHISPWRATVGLFATAAAVLREVSHIQTCFLCGHLR